MKKIDSYWVSMAGIIIGVVIICGSGTVSGGNSNKDFEMIKFAGTAIAGGLIVASGILSLTILQIFSKNKDNDEKK